MRGGGGGGSANSIFGGMGIFLMSHLPSQEHGHSKYEDASKERNDVLLCN